MVETDIPQPYIPFVSFLSGTMILATQAGLIGVRQSLSLQWRHNERDGVSNRQLHDCWINRLFRCKLEKTSKLRVTGCCEGKSPVTGEFPTQKGSNAEMFPFDDVMMMSVGKNWGVCEQFPYSTFYTRNLKPFRGFFFLDCILCVTMKMKFEECYTQIRSPSESVFRGFMSFRNESTLAYYHFDALHAARKPCFHITFKMAKCFSDHYETAINIHFIDAHRTGLLYYNDTLLIQCWL